MKPFIASLYALFLFAMISGVVVAYRNAEGLVENDYYRKQDQWFKAKTGERALGLEVKAPESLTTGTNEVTFCITEHGKPLRHASVQLFVGGVVKNTPDFTLPMRETDPGVYVATARVPSKGKWLVRMDLATPQLNTSRSWFYDVR